MTGRLIPVPAGAAQTICVCVQLLIEHDWPPMVAVGSAVAGPKLVPEIVTVLPPAAEPAFGEIALTVGAEYVNVTAGFDPVTLKFPR
jgi:hypothetical protein